MPLLMNLHVGPLEALYPKPQIFKTETFQALHTIKMSHDFNLTPLEGCGGDLRGVPEVLGLGA